MSGRVSLHSPSLPMLGDPENLASWRRGPVLLRRAQSEVVEDPVDGVLIAHEGEDAHALAATDADERIHLVDLGDQPGPAWGAAPPGLRFGRDGGVVSGSEQWAVPRTRFEYSP